MSAPFSPVPDDQDGTIPAADAGAGAPEASPGTGVAAEEPNRSANNDATSPTDNAAENRGASDGSDGDADTQLDTALQGRKDPLFRTPAP